MVQLIAIGNRLMTDDGVAVIVAESLSEQFVDERLTVIVAETDTLYAFDRLSSDDFLILLDAQKTGAEAGTINVYDLAEVLRQHSRPIFRHDMTLLDLLVESGEVYRGIVIGIEADCLEMGYGLSETLETQFASLCYKIIELIFTILTEEEKCTTQKEQSRVYPMQTTSE